MADNILPFVIKAHDALAIRTVRYWIEQAHEEGVNPDKIRSAVAHLQTIIAYQRAHPEEVKLPD